MAEPSPSVREDPNNQRPAEDVDDREGLLAGPPRNAGGQGGHGHAGGERAEPHDQCEFPHVSSSLYTCYIDPHIYYIELWR